MGTQLRDALIEAGVPEMVRVDVPKERTLWHEVFRITLTKFEIPILIKVKCDREYQGLRAIASRNLNSVDGGDKQATQAELETRLNQWFLEPNTGVGMLRYWKLYEEMKEL